MNKRLKFKAAEIENKKAYHDYFVESEIECGIALKGNEVKSIERGSCSIKDAYCFITGKGLFIKGMHITAWKTANAFDIDEDRDKQLLANKSEIRDMRYKVRANGYTLIPLKVYKSDSNKYKVLVGVCRGKKNYDKREALKQKQIKRDIERMGY